jgi:hypothetical protein
MAVTARLYEQQGGRLKERRARAQAWAAQMPATDYAAMARDAGFFVSAVCPQMRGLVVAEAELSVWPVAIHTRTAGAIGIIAAVHQPAPQYGISRSLLLRWRRLRRLSSRRSRKRLGAGLSL